MLLKIYPENPNPKAVDKAVEVLRNGGILIYPTDTVYGIGCDMFQAKTVERVCQFKGIDPRKATFSIICYDLSQISAYAKVDNSIFKLLKRNLPGAFTFILNGSNNLPKLFKGRKTIGIRMPDNSIIRAIVDALGHPIYTTSIKEANEVTEYETDPELLHLRYGDLAEMVIDGGFGDNTASTVVDCTDVEPQIIRQGKQELKL
ncbi:MAG: threonylcarbamoyl-AMP synthase [Prevotellaceae bacterium]|jgi:tRNA threonylcarbamoyl adenosine modification protein (Sua5/YciO/YrdC/YwlC family)|nr:threonylcarbamoyl-AMP synthase [Prevotellaceae bacterium]